MFHHLPISIKREGLKEIYRVLKKDGRFFLTDFDKPSVFSAPLMFLMLIWISPTRFQLFGKLPALIKEVGFEGVSLVKKGFFVNHYLIKKHKGR